MQDLGCGVRARKIARTMVQHAYVFSRVKNPIDKYNDTIYDFSVS